MTVVIAVRFKTSGKSYYFDPLDFELAKGDSVIVETTRGVEIGEITMDRTEVAESDIVPPLKKVLRVATEEDKEHARENREKEKWAMGVCQEKIAQHNLEMKLIDVEYTFDNNKVLFYFTSDGRVDFRELVKDLASVFKTRIELRQIGVRDEAKILGGIGVCGRCLCCKSFLGDFHPVSIKMAKEQGLPLNPTKISGSCGRLMCCLKYEQDAYEYLLSKTPAVGAIVDTERGRGAVVSVSLLKGLLKVRLDDGNESDLVEFGVEEVRLIKGPSKRSREKPADADAALAPAAGAVRKTGGAAPDAVGAIDAIGDADAVETADDADDADDADAVDAADAADDVDAVGGYDVSDDADAVGGFDASGEADAVDDFDAVDDVDDVGEYGSFDAILDAGDVDEIVAIDAAEAIIEALEAAETIAAFDSDIDNVIDNADEFNIIENNIGATDTTPGA